MNKAKIFHLLGHDNPLGEYPAPVVPIGYLDKKLVAAFARLNDTQLMEVPEGSTYVQHEEQTQQALENFDYCRHRLFAFSETQVQMYPAQDEPEFLSKWLSNPMFSSKNPFLRLSLAHLTPDARWQANEIHSCIEALVDIIAPTDFINQWYGKQRHVLSLRLNIPEDDIPASYADFLVSKKFSGPFRKPVIFMLPPSTKLLVYVNPSRARLRPDLVLYLRETRETYGKLIDRKFRAHRRGDVVELFTYEVLRLKTKMTRKSSLLSCKALIQGIRMEAESLNQAYRIISKEFEIERRTHTGNVFKNVLFADLDGTWKPLSILRTRITTLLRKH